MVLAPLAVPHGEERSGLGRRVDMSGPDVTLDPFCLAPGHGYRKGAGVVRVLLGDFPPTNHRSIHLCV